MPKVRRSHTKRARSPYNRRNTRKNKSPSSAERNANVREHMELVKKLEKEVRSLTARLGKN